MTMAKCTLVFEDTLDGEVTANVSFDPPFETGSRLTHAQSLGVRVLEKCLVVSEAQRAQEIERLRSLDWED